MHVSRLQPLLFACLTLLACRGSETPAPPPGPSTVQTVTANSRLAWDQMASDAAELSGIRYAVYVDAVRSELTGVSCASESTNGSFACSARMPAMSAGSHQLQLASFLLDGETVLESMRTVPITVTFVAGTTATAAQRPERLAGHRAAAGGALLDLPVVATGFDGVSDLAFAPDGRLFVAERSGRIRVVRGGRLLAAPALDLRSGRERDQVRVAARDRDEHGSAVRALALDPQFPRTRSVYVLYTAPSRRGAPSYVVARYREAGDTLGDRVVLLDDVRAAPDDPAGTLRFGPDGKLYVALGAAGDSRAAGDLASPNGKVLRLNTDGTTPDDQAGASPMFSAAYTSPRGLGWDPESGLLWALDRPAAGRAELHAVAAAPFNGRKRGTTKATMGLPEPFEPSGLVFFHDSVMIASGHGGGLLRSRIDPQERTRIVNTDRLLEQPPEGVRALAVGPDGAIYLATAREIRRLVLE